MTSAELELQKQRQSLLRGIVSNDIAAIATHPDQEPLSAEPMELAGLSPRAVEKRKREFIAGRAAAQAALMA